MSLVDRSQKAFLTLFNTELGSKFIVDYASIPEQEEAYGTVGLVSLYQKHKTEQHYNLKPDNFEEELRETFEGIITVQTFGDYDYSLIENARTLLRFSDSLYFLFDRDISLIDVGSIRRVPERRETVYLPKASFDLHFYITGSYSRSVDWIEEVGIHESIYSAGSKKVDEELRIKRSNN